MMNPVEIQKLWQKAPFPIIVTIILCLASQAILTPQQDNLKESESALVQTVHGMKGSLLARSAEIQKQSRFELVEQQMQRLNRWLPEESYLPILVEQCNRLADLFAVKLSAVQYKYQDREKGDLPNFRLTFTLKGEYAAMRAFVQALECLPSPLFLNEIIAKKDQTYTLTLTQLIKP